MYDGGIGYCAGVAGTLALIRRYPVKSMLGEDIARATVDARGIAGDRRLALVHRETGRVASAKHPRVWRGLLTLRAHGAFPGVRITAPDGTCRPAADPDVHEWLSALLGQPVDLVDAPPPEATLDRAVPEEVLRHGVTADVPVKRSHLGGGAPAGTFFDFAPLHLVTTSTLARLRELGSGAQPDRYRPNLVVATARAGFVENAWVGRTVRVGPDLVLRVLVPTARCAVPTLAHGDLCRDPEALRVPARHNRVVPLPALGPQPCVGVYAEVLSPGSVSTGDDVRLD